MENNIITKLRLDKYNKVAIVNLPQDLTYFDSLTFDLKYKDIKYDCIIAFVMTLTDIKKIIDNIIKKDLLEEKGRIYFAYPKKGNKKYDEYIERDQIFPYLKVSDDTGYIAGTDYKFVRMVSLDEVFTIVGLSYEKERTKKTTKKSQRVADYVAMIPQLKEVLKQDEKALELYENLTPGYQRDWARYVYSAKSKATIDKRIKETIKILKAGYKSINRYQQAKST